mmetsp:Transcript_22332/g.57210  ORF Transcript_22332/g.57210 Transcript_22332/m.57210 type:complete len:255 (-) Transcript_22332:65-829(-)
MVSGRKSRTAPSTGRGPAGHVGGESGRCRCCHVVHCGRLPFFSEFPGNFTLEIEPTAARFVFSRRSRQMARCQLTTSIGRYEQSSTRVRQRCRVRSLQRPSGPSSTARPPPSGLTLLARVTPSSRSSTEKLPPRGRADTVAVPPDAADAAASPLPPVALLFGVVPPRFFAAWHTTSPPARLGYTVVCGAGGAARVCAPWRRRATRRFVIASGQLLPLADGLRSAKTLTAILSSRAGKIEIPPSSLGTLESRRVG